MDPGLSKLGYKSGFNLDFYRIVKNFLLSKKEKKRLFTGILQISNIHKNIKMP